MALPTSHDDPLFELTTDTLGPLKTNRLKVSGAVDLGSIWARGEPPAPGEVINRLISVTATKPSGHKVTEAEAATLADSEREAFAERYLDASPDLPVVNSAEGPPPGEGEFKREDGETPASFLSRVLKGQVRIDPIDPAVARMLKTWSQPGLDALRVNSSLFNSIGSQLAALKGLDIAAAGKIRDPFIGRKIPDLNLGLTETAALDRVLSPPPNPGHETNKRLAELIERFGHIERLALDTVQLIHTMNGAASELLQSFVVGAESTERLTRRAIVIAILALGAAVVMPIAQLGWDVYKTTHSDGEGKSAGAELIEKFTAGQRRSLEDMRDALASALAQGAAQNRAVSDALDRFIQELRRESEQRGRQVLAPAAPAVVPPTQGTGEAHPTPPARPGAVK